MKEMDYALQLHDGRLAQRCAVVLGTFLDSLPRFKGPVTAEVLSTLDGKEVKNLKKGKKNMSGRDEIVMESKPITFEYPCVTTPDQFNSLEQLKVILN
jgi:hypothetical protein